MSIGAALVTSVLVLQAAPPRDTRTLTLERATQKALKSQPQIRAAHAQTQAAKARADETLAPLMPQINASATYLQAKGTFAPRTVSFGQGSAFCPVTSAFGHYDCWNFGVAADQLIYDFGASWERWRSARSTATAQAYFELTTKLQTVLAVRVAYFQARSQKSLIGVADETVVDQDRHLVQIQAFVQVGTRPDIDLAQARANAANARVQLILAENAYTTAKAQLNQVMGLVGSTDYDVADDDFPPVPGEDQPTEALAQSAILARPELATLTKQIEASEQLLRAAKGAYGPTLGAAAGLAEAGALDDLSRGWTAQVTLSWPLFQGMLVPAQVREAGANLAFSQTQRDLGVLQIRFDVEQARLAVRANKATLVAVEDAYVNARLQLRLAEGRYESGTGSIIELTDAQTALTFAAGQRVTAEYNIALARAQLLRALGRD